MRSNPCVRRAIAAEVMAALALAAPVAAAAQDDPPSPYRDSCDQRHGAQSTGGLGPALTGEAFKRTWATKRPALFVPKVETCMTYAWPPGPGRDISWQAVPRPKGDGRFGRVAAFNLRTRTTAWTERTRSAPSSAPLATGGGPLFEGSHDRWFRALDSRTGATFRRTRLSDVPSSFPIAFFSAAGTPIRRGVQRRRGADRRTKRRHDAGTGSPTALDHALGLKPLGLEDAIG